MEKHIEVSYLLQIYGKLLTTKQYTVLNYYYNDDLSLSEIGENTGITRQAVRDVIKKGENKLFEFEKVLKIMKNTQKNEKTLQLVFSKISQIKETSSDKKIEKILNEVQKELSLIA